MPVSIPLVLANFATHLDSSSLNFLSMCWILSLFIFHYLKVFPLFLIIAFNTLNSSGYRSVCIPHQNVILVTGGSGSGLITAIFPKLVQGLRLWLLHKYLLNKGSSREGRSWCLEVYSVHWVQRGKPHARVIFEIPDGRNHIKFHFVPVLKGKKNFLPIVLLGFFRC